MIMMQKPYRMRRLSVWQLWVFTPFTCISLHLDQLLYYRCVPVIPAAFFESCRNPH